MRISSTVSSNQQNIHILRTLLDDLKKMVDKYYCWGRPLGSTLVWEQHLQTLEKICQVASSIQNQGGEYGLIRVPSLTRSRSLKWKEGSC